MKNFNHCLTLTFILFCSNVFAQTNGIDLTFGDNGMVKTDINGKFDDATDIFILDNGKIIAAGNSMVGSHYEFYVAQYSADGTLDESFGNSGFATIEFSTFHCLVKALTVQENGKIIVVGNYDNNYYTDPVIARFNSDGSIDTAFGENGLLKFDLSAQFDDFNDVVVQPDGKILVVGSSYKYGTDDFLLVRFLEDGSLDETFGVDGFVYTDFDDTEDIIFSVLLQKDNKIIVSGYSGYGSVYFAAARYLENGLIDPSFSADGKVTLSSGSRVDKSYGITFQSDSSIVLAGTHHAGATDEYMFARIDKYGTPDITFGAGGIVYLPTLNAADKLTDVIAQPDDRIVASGSRNNDAVFVRLTKNGSPDNTFGDAGILKVAEADGTNILNSIVMNSENTIIACGTANQDDYSDFLLMQINFDIQSSVEPLSSNAGTHLIYPNPASDWLNVRPDNAAGSLQEVVITNITGQVVYSEKPNLFDDTFGIKLSSDLPAGNYIVNMVCTNGIQSSKLQIIK